MSDESEKVPHNYCNECHKEFPDSFALIDHFHEKDEEFDPYYILPNGFKLYLGSMLRFLFEHADQPEQIKLLTQSTYVTLFASEMGYDMVDELIEDMLVNSALQDFDNDLKDLLDKGHQDEEGGE